MSIANPYVQTGAGNVVPVVEPRTFRNRIINGNFDIWQRGTVQTPVLAGKNYSTDRWFIEAQADGGTFVGGSGWSRQAFILGQTTVPGNPKYFASFSGTATGAGNNAYWVVAQPIESVLTMAGTKATLSFYIATSTGNPVTLQFRQYFGSGGSPSGEVRFGTQVITTSTDFEKKTITVDIPSIAGKTLGNDGNDSLQLIFWGKAGSTVGATVGTGTVADVGILYLSQVQLEPGTVATPFEFRPYGAELALCQRYYFSSKGTSELPSHSFYAYSISDLIGNASFPVQMRTETPSIEIYSFGATAKRVALQNSGTDVGTNALAVRTPYQVSSRWFQKIMDTGNPFTVGQYYWFYYTASAEL